VKPRLTLNFQPSRSTQARVTQPSSDIIRYRISLFHSAPRQHSLFALNTSRRLLCSNLLQPPPHIKHSHQVATHHHLLHFRLYNMATQGQSKAKPSNRKSPQVKPSPSSGEATHGQDAEMSDARPALTPDSIDDGRSETAPATVSTGEN
jgi:hypothetical protein